MLRNPRRLGANHRQHVVVDRDRIAYFGKSSQQFEDETSGGLGVGVGKRHAADVGEHVERASGVDFVNVALKGRDLRGFAVELILNRADQFL